MNAGMLPVTPAFFEGAIEEQVPEFGAHQSEAALAYVRTFRPDRETLINRLRNEFPGLDEEFTEHDVVDEMEDMAREGLEREMIHVGLDQPGARRVAQIISLSIVLPER